MHRRDILFFILFSPCAANLCSSFPQYFLITNLVLRLSSYPNQRLLRHRISPLYNYRAPLLQSGNAVHEHICDLFIFTFLKVNILVNIICLVSNSNHVVLLARCRWLRSIYKNLIRRLLFSDRLLP